jgi:ribosome-binding protein aMBF1 (putative translation factor)
MTDEFMKEVVYHSDICKLCGKLSDGCMDFIDEYKTGEVYRVCLHCAEIITNRMVYKIFIIDQNKIYSDNTQQRFLVEGVKNGSTV